MNAEKANWGERLRIIWAIAVKDIVDALKNKTTLSIMLGTAIVMVSSQALPLLLGLRNIPTALVYDPAGSAMVEELTQRQDFTLRSSPSQDEMLATVADSLQVPLGFVLPADFEARAANGESIQIEGYMAHGAKQAQVAEYVDFFERQFSQAAGVPVSIELDGRTVYPPPESSGAAFMFSTSLVIVLFITGALLAPILLMEEKETHTLEALLVSPARYGLVIGGKALAGLFYCLTAAVIVFALNLRMVNLWGLAFVAVLSGSLFTVAVGLLMGSLFENLTAMNAWLGLLMGVMTLPVFLGGVLGSNMPAFLRSLMPLLPSVALAKLLNATYAASIPPDLLWPNLALVLGGTLLLFALAIWRVSHYRR